MRADEQFRTYEQALTVVQRLGDSAVADHKLGNHQEAQYQLSHAIFVGVKHLLFMAADASVDRAEARALAANNHLAVVDLLSLTLKALDGDVKEGSGTGSVDATRPKRKSVSKVGAKAVSASKKRRRG